MEELQLGGIFMVPIIVAIVELAKKWFKLPADYAPLLNGVLSVFVYVAMVYGQASANAEVIIAMIINAIVYFLVGAGVYEAGKPTIKKVFRT